VFCVVQLTADAMLMYGINVKQISKVVAWMPRLQQVTVQKLCGAAAESIKQVISQHDRQMEEILDADTRKGQCGGSRDINLHIKCLRDFVLRSEITAE